MKKRRWFRSHLSIGPLCIFGNNAMHWAWQLCTRRGYLVARPSTPCRHGGWWRWYIYLSPDGTPGGAKWAFGPGVDRQDKTAAYLRRHGYCHCLHSNGRDECPSEIHATYYTGPTPTPQETP